MFNVGFFAFQPFQPQYPRPGEYDIGGEVHAYVDI